MEGRPRVYVCYVSRRNKFILQWTDSKGRKRQKTSEAKTRRIAEREAGELEAELDESASGQGWAEFVLRYETEHQASWRKGSRDVWHGALAALDRYAPPHDVGDVDASSLSKVVAGLRAERKADETIRGYLKYIRASLHWARDVAGVIKEAPRFRMPKRKTNRQARSRPVLGEEFDRMLEVCAKVKPSNPQPWRDILEAMYWGGLRLSEVVSLSWDWTNDFALLLDHDPPVLKMTSAQKSGKDQLVPMAPEFRELCKRLPRHETGKVFRGLPGQQQVGKVIAKIGRTAGVIVNDKGKFASSHDLRRSFGTRWATRLKPAELMELMRHESIDTTMSYYVALDLRDLASKLDRFFPAHLSGAQNDRENGRLPKDWPAKELGDVGGVHFGKTTLHPEGDIPDENDTGSNSERE